MKKLGLIAISLVLIGAGCASGSATNSGTDGGVFKTVNAGQDWGQVVVVPTAVGIGTLATTDVINMEMDPQDKSYLYIGTRSTGMLFSEDAGASWRQPTNDVLKEGSVLGVAVDPTDVCTVYIAKGPRLLRTEDCLRSLDTETYVDNRAGISVVKVVVDWYNHRNIWIGLNNGDVLKSTDAGHSWETVLKTGNEISSILMSRADSRQVLISTFKSGFFQTVDGGQNWNKPEGGLSALKQSTFVYSMTQTADSKVVIAASVYGLVRSTDFGSTWEPITLVTSPGQVIIRAVAVDPTDPNTIYYAANSTFYRSVNGGSTWDTERFPTSRVPRSILVDPQEKGMLYIGVAAEIE